jgi:hypothetical protein
MSDIDTVVKLAADLADLYESPGPDDEIVTVIHGWQTGQKAVPITLGQLRAAKRVRAAMTPACPHARDGAGSGEGR